MNMIWLRGRGNIRRACTGCTKSILQPVQAGIYRHFVRVELVRFELVRFELVRVELVRV
jgi:Ni,Fe-hydrogenase I small subunit